MKKLILIFVAAFIAMPANAEMLLTGGVKYTTNSAREELLQHKPQKLYEKLPLIHLDENHDENISTLLQGKTEIKDRTLAIFSDNSYAVMHKSDEYHVYYYSPNGKLTHIEVKDRVDYPYKTYKYNTQGNLVNMGLRVSKPETFIFDKNGKLIAHWLKNYGYDENGNIIMTRKYLE